ncbi:flagellar synthesis protein [Methylovorus sp. MM2]|uniref:flagellar protein FliT n=1 Tax=Methylovorus sp. MM2 TaxID=1848038 RepID=UPI0007DFC8CE|nr:flagellar protein FliT [Methylovorus sp. MM2]OAM51254.1 flagellar synthesis protein [Methylovorus sp. MM2]
MGQNTTVAIYESVAKITNQMLLAAQQQNWEKLAQLELDCAAYVKKLQNSDEESLSGRALERKVASLKKILEDDREIRNLVNPWEDKIAKIINTTHFDKRRRHHSLQ